jgi:DNA-binding MarR family transcriptional regulator
MALSVRRERDPDDRRKVLVSPAPEALTRIAAQYQQYTAHTEGVLGRRSPDELRVIADFLAEMVDVGPAS